MAQPRSSEAGRVTRRGHAHAILCVLPRRLPTNPLRHLLLAYELAVAGSWTAALRLARHKAYDLYVVYAPLGWADPLEVCRRIRAFDAHTPVILYSAQPSKAERREAVASQAIQAYVARSEDAHNLAATAGQLIMLTELRSMEAMRLGVDAIESHVVRRLARLGLMGTATDALSPRMAARLKIEACRMFAVAGGSRANFERLWPSIYEAAAKRTAVSGGR